MDFRQTWVFRATQAGLVAGGVGLLGASVSAETIALKATLSPANEMLAVKSRAFGSAELTYDTITRVLSWSLQHTGLTGAHSDAHLHGPAGPGEIANPVITLSGTASHDHRTAKLTDAQAAELLAGRWYINMHTPANPNGEIRGQVLRVR